MRRRLSQGTLMDETRGPADEGETGVGGAGIGRFASLAARRPEQLGSEGRRWWEDAGGNCAQKPHRKPHCCLLPRNPLGLLVRRKRDAIV